MQSIIAGMGMSGLAMLFAAVGFLPPIAVALTQEAIDVAVILNALRALTTNGKSVPILRWHRRPMLAATWGP